MSGDNVIWEYTVFADPVWHRLRVTFDENGCNGTWHHDYVDNNFTQSTSYQTCSKVVEGGVAALRMPIASVRADSTAR